MTVTFSDVISDPRRIVKKVLKFSGVRGQHFEALPQQLDHSQDEMWRNSLMPEEQATVRKIVREDIRKFDALCQLFGSKLVAE